MVGRKTNIRHKNYFLPIMTYPTTRESRPMWERRKLRNFLTILQQQKQQQQQQLLLTHYDISNYKWEQADVREERADTFSDDFATTTTAATTTAYPLWHIQLQGRAGQCVRGESWYIFWWSNNNNKSKNNNHSSINYILPIMTYPTTRESRPMWDRRKLRNFLTILQQAPQREAAVGSESI